jgi:hypothetical protein
VARYIVGGDSRNDKAHVLPWAFKQAHARHATAFFFLGDMELTSSFDPHFSRELALLDPIPFYPVLGNHEVKRFGLVPLGVHHGHKKFRERFLDNARTPVKSALDGEVVYSVNLPGGLHFVALDNVSQKGFGSRQLEWLDADLDRARQDAGVKHIVVTMHEPLAKNGVSTHGMDDDGPEALADSQAALASFVKHKVSLIIASHVHGFASFEQGGIQSYITGGLGAPLKEIGTERSFHHFLQLDVDDKGIKVDVVRFDGAPAIAAPDEED